MRKRKFQGNQHLELSGNDSSSDMSKKSKRGRPLKATLERKALARPLLHSTPKGKETREDLGSVPARRSSRSRNTYSLSGNLNLSNEISENSATGYRFIDVSILSNVFEQLLCPGCSSASLTLTDNFEKKNGCASFLFIECISCHWNLKFCTSINIQGSYEINKRFVYAMRSVGQGFSGAKKFCSVMNIPHLPSKNNYAKISKQLRSAAYNVAKQSMKDAGSEMRSLLGYNSTECGVSVDGTWQKRGFISLNGCVTAISIETGKILDVEPMCRKCKGCEVHSKWNKHSPAYHVWKLNHVNCKANFDGSAPAMEPEGANRIFQRSKETHGLHYTKFYGDGDSKSFLSVKNIYKDDGLSVEKYECIGHVQKRMGAALRKLKKEKKELGGKGKLTSKTIDKFQNYYGMAIRSNVGNLKSMKMAILATLFHCSSSEKNEYHSYCPEGADSWCGFQADKASQTNRYKGGPGLPLNVIAELKPVFARLSDDQLLKKCLHGRTQNLNESFNRMIWDRVPKATYIGKDLLDIGIYDAVIHFNNGAIAYQKVLQAMGIEPGRFTAKHCQELDDSRMKSFQWKEKESSKTARRKLRAKRKSRDDKNKEKEGETYMPGDF